MLYILIVGCEVLFNKLCSKRVATAVCGLNDVLKYTFKEA